MHQSLRLSRAGLAVPVAKFYSKSSNKNIYFQFQSFQSKFNVVVVVVVVVDGFVKGVHRCLEGVHKSLYAYWSEGVAWSLMAGHPVICVNIWEYTNCVYSYNSCIYMVSAK